MACISWANMTLIVRLKSGNFSFVPNVSQDFSHVLCWSDSGVTDIWTSDAGELSVRGQAPATACHSLSRWASPMISPVQISWYPSSGSPQQQWSRGWCQVQGGLVMWPVHPGQPPDCRRVRRLWSAQTQGQAGVRLGVSGEIWLWRQTKTKPTLSGDPF